MFCHQYPTRACVTGNSEVRSLWHNVSSSRKDGRLTVRSGDDCQHQGGRGLGSCGTVNRGESPINVVSFDQLKMLTSWNQKVSGQAQVLLTHLTQMSHHRRRGET